jgi:FkbM family methyltransferase
MFPAVSFKSGAQGLLKQAGLYHRLKASSLYDVYWTLFDSRWIEDRTKEVAFYRSVLPGLRRGDVIFDVGANDGCKTDVFLRLGAKVVAVEPDETNVEVLKGKFLRSRVFPKPVTIEKVAVSDKAGKMALWIDMPGSALNTLNPKWAQILRTDQARFDHPIAFATQTTVDTTTLDRLIHKHGAPYYIKIDVEGHERSVLAGLQRPVPYLSFEVNLPEFREEGIECISHLSDMTPAGQFNYTADCRLGLALREWQAPMDFLHLLERCNERAIEIFWRTPGGK